MVWFELVWVDLGWFGLTWDGLNWFGLGQFELVWVRLVRACFEPVWVDLGWFGLSIWDGFELIGVEQMSFALVSVGFGRFRVGFECI